MLFLVLWYLSRIVQVTVIFYDLLMVAGGFGVDGSIILLRNAEVVCVLFFGFLMYGATCRVFFSCFTVVVLIDKLAHNGNSGCYCDLNVDYVI